MIFSLVAAWPLASFPFILFLIIFPYHRLEHLIYSVYFIFQPIQYSNTTLPFPFHIRNLLYSLYVILKCSIKFWLWGPHLIKNLEEEEEEEKYYRIDHVINTISYVLRVEPMEGQMSRIGWTVMSPHNVQLILCLFITPSPHDLAALFCKLSGF